MLVLPVRSGEFSRLHLRRASSSSSRQRFCIPQRRSALRVRAARSSGGEEREQALRQQWQEAAPEEQQGQYEGGPYGAQQYYQQYPAYPPYGAPQPESSGGIPWGWVITGGVAAIVISKVVEFFSPANGGPQAKMMNFMMKQAMKGAGGSKDMPAGFPDLSKMGAASGMPSGFPGSGFPSASTSSQRASPIVDTQARPVDVPTGSGPASSSSATEASKPGAKFEEMKAQGRRRRRAAQDGPAAASSNAFTDVDEEEAAGPSGATAEPSPGEAGAGDEASMQMLEQFMQDPNMQELLYQYLPEPMRNKETFDWMLKNPEYRAQLQSMMQAQGAQLNPEVFKQMQGIDSEEVTRQLEEHGMTPSDVIQKIMSEPELAAAFSKPKVQQAILELQSNPMAMLKYQDDPDVMLVLEKMSSMFPQVSGAGGEGSPAGMPVSS